MNDFCQDDNWNQDKLSKKNQIMTNVIHLMRKKDASLWSFEALGLSMTFTYHIWMFDNFGIYFNKLSPFFDA